MSGVASWTGGWIWDSKRCGFEPRNGIIRASWVVAGGVGGRQEEVTTKRPVRMEGIKKREGREEERLNKERKGEREMERDDRWVDR